MSEDHPLACCYWMGPIDSLIHKLTQLMNNISQLQLKPVIDDLRELQGNLNKLAGRRAAGEQVEVWAKHVRETAYDMEDCIDLRQTSFSELDMKQISDFKKKIEQALDRCKRYELLSQAPAPDPEIYGDRGKTALAKEIYGDIKLQFALMGAEKSIKDTKAELLVLLDLEKQQKELRVVSILGDGGCGKTTLAKEIYGEIYGGIKWQFDCHAFVSVGRTMSPRTAVTQILCQVNPEVDAQQAWKCNQQQVITLLWEFLRDKRYFICIDDIRCTTASNDLNCALPYNNLGSRILTTTRREDIAISCSRCPSDFVYKMPPLGEYDCNILFSKGLHVQNEESLDEETSKKILQVCDGVPLAIIITSGLLSVQSNLLNSDILSDFGQSDSTCPAMRKILEMSYGDLSLPLKSCFLYLSSFPTNDRINKDRLIRRWIAEGLIPKIKGKSFWETGESYFNELISRRLIQGAFDDEFEDDQPIGCSIVGVVFDFMESLSADANFVTAGFELKSGLYPCARARRVSLDCNDVEKMMLVLQEEEEKDEDKGIILSHLSWVRALALYGDARRLPDFSSFKLVRVLDLEDTKGLENKQLESIGNLTLLRYLALRGNDVTVLPREIMALKHLATLDLRGTRVKRLPEFRGTKMVSLLANSLIVLPGMTVGMQNMEELSKVSLGLDGSVVYQVGELLNKMENLRMLGVRFSCLHDWGGKDEGEVKYFLEEVGKSNLQSLLLDNYPHVLTGLLVDSWAQRRPQRMTKFELRIRGSTYSPHVAERIDSLVDLTHLHISIQVVGALGVWALGKLPRLVLLKIYSDTCSRTSVCAATSSAKRLTVPVCGEYGFQRLKVLSYSIQHGGRTMLLLRFEAGAMPQLQMLALDFSVQETSYSYGDFDLGIQNLSSLKQVRATIDCKDVSTASEVEAHIRDQVSQNPSCPDLEFMRTVQRQCSAVEAQDKVIDIHSLEEWSSQIEEADRSVPKKLVVIDFTASRCGPSLYIASFVADLSKRFPDVVFLKVDVDEMETIAEAFGVEFMPTFVFMREGKEKSRVVGALKEELEENLHRQMKL